MDIFNFENIKFILLFFVPGLISMKVYDLFVSSDRRNYTSSILEAVSFSIINFALLFWLISIITSNSFQANHPIFFYLIFLFVIFIAPIFWVLLYKAIISLNVVRRYTIHPIHKPWDFVFGKNQSFWVIVHMKDGRKIGGMYDTKSFSSSFPAPEQIYLQEVWKLDDKGAFQNKIDRSAGIIISESEYKAIELFNLE